MDIFYFRLKIKKLEGHIITKNTAESSTGFSLIEILTVIVILGILAAVAVPSMKPMIENLQLSMVTNSMKHQLICARTRALGDSKIHCGVHFDTLSKPQRLQAFLDVGNPEHDGIYTAGSDQKFGAAYVLPPTIKFTISGTGGNKDIVYRGDGSAKINGIIITVKTSRGKTKTLTVLPSTGRTKIN